MQRHGFYPRGGGPRWKPGRPYHVALEDTYIRTNWGTIEALCKLNGIPMHSTGEKIQDGGLWVVHEFQWQINAMMVWSEFAGRWLLGTEFSFPERRADMPRMKQLGHDPKKFRTRDNGWL